MNKFDPKISLYLKRDSLYSINSSIFDKDTNELVGNVKLRFSIIIFFLMVIFTTGVFFLSAWMLAPLLLTNNLSKSMNGLSSTLFGVIMTTLIISLVFILINKTTMIYIRGTELNGNIRINSLLRRKKWSYKDKITGKKYVLQFKNSKEGQLLISGSKYEVVIDENTLHICKANNYEGSKIDIEALNSTFSNQYLLRISQQTTRDILLFLAVVVIHLHFTLINSD